MRSIYDMVINAGSVFALIQIGGYWTLVPAIVLIVWNFEDGLHRRSKL